MVPGSTCREVDLATSSAEQRTRTFDVSPAVPAGNAGPVSGDVLKNRFVLHQCLADGTTSRLFRALDRRREAAGDPEPWVALKVVTAPPGPGIGEREARAVQALRREAAIARGLDHPNLPRIIGIDHDGPHTFVCMAWLEGESLAAILDSRGARPMTRVQALHILDDIGRALIHLHALGITHADVKPGNVLVTPQGKATLLDFGVATGPGAGDLPAVRGFTPEYASPEVLAGSEPEPADDLFSLACVAYRMLGGHRAFGAVTAREAAATGSRPPCPGQLSPAQWRALDRGLAFARAERQPDIATFLAQLKGARDERQAVTDLPAPEPPLATAPPSRPSSRGVRALLRPPAILLAIATVGVTGAVWLQRPADPLPLPATVPAPVQAPAGVEPSLPVPAATPRPAPATRAPPAPEVPVTATPRELPARKPAPPLELAGPPVPEPAAAGSVPPVPVPLPAAAPPGGALVDTTASVRDVPFSRLTIRRYIEPEYPRKAAARRVPGWVDVAFTVDPAGRTGNVRVIGADPPGLFDESAVAAVRRWRFGAMQSLAGAGPGAEPVHSRIRLRFEPAGAPGRR